MHIGYSREKNFHIYFGNEINQNHQYHQEYSVDDEIIFEIELLRPNAIIKIPKNGEFLANIAQGASYKAIKLTDAQKNNCDYFAQKLMKSGVDWIAFDLLGDFVSEVNITCPGLLVEVSSAHQKNLALQIN